MIVVWHLCLPVYPSHSDTTSYFLSLPPDEFMGVRASAQTSPLSTILPVQPSSQSASAAFPIDIVSLCNAIRDQVNGVNIRLHWLTQLPEVVPSPTPSAQPSVFARAWTAANTITVVRWILTVVTFIVKLPLLLYRSFNVVREFVWGSDRPMCVAGLGYHRQSLAVLKCGKQIWVQTIFGYKIDAMVFPSVLNVARVTGTPATLIPSARAAQIAGSLELQAKLASSAGDLFRCADGSVPPLVVMCNPNAGMYEQSGNSCEWLDFYGKLGFNVVEFNYGCVLFFLAWGVGDGWRHRWHCMGGVLFVDGGLWDGVIGASTSGLLSSLQRVQQE